jgi:hypothetical protein
MGYVKATVVLNDTANKEEFMQIPIISLRVGFKGGVIV